MYMGITVENRIGKRQSARADCNHRVLALDLLKENCDG
jgi:hypothetical protein